VRKNVISEIVLLELARKKFASSNFSRAEEEVFRAAQTGEQASARSGDEMQDDPANAGNWHADRVVRAECIAWLCTDREASALVAHRGIRIIGMRIDGELDLSRAEIKFPFRILNSAFTGRTLLQDTQLPFLSLQGCHVKELHGDRLKVSGSVFLRNGFKAEGEVRLVGATMADLDCTCAQFLNSNGPALSADGVQIKGGALLRNGFKAQGEVRLVGATIDGVLDCTGAQFSNSNGAALSADGVEIKAGAYFCNGFKAEGEVNLTEATVSDLQIRGVLEPDKTILDLRSAKAGTFWDDEHSWPKAGNLFLDGFRYERLYAESPLDAKSRGKWLHRQPSDKFLPQPYEQLAATLRNMGHERDARLVMIQKNRDQAAFTRFLGQRWWWYNFFGRAIGYGYAPWRAFVGSVLMIVLGWFLFAFGSSHDLISPAKESAYEKTSNGQFVLINQKRKLADDYPVFNPFVYSLESFTPLLKLDQGANWTPNANHGAQVWLWHCQVTTGGLLRWYLWIHIIAGWVLTTLWVGAVTGLVKS
jgi:sRNA-binding regulator protein Hfq